MRYDCIFKGSVPVQVQQKIFFRVQFRFGFSKKFFFGFSSGSGSTIFFLGVQFRFSSGSGSEYIFFIYFLQALGL